MTTRFPLRRLAPALAVAAAVTWAPRAQTQAPAQPPATAEPLVYPDEPVETLEPPAHPLPPESATAGETKFSFIAYGDTRGGGRISDGEQLHPIHAALIDGMLQAITDEAAAGFPVRFVVQSGDAVQQGRVGHMWNVGFLPNVRRLMADGDVPYFFAVGNHDVGGAGPDREIGMRNVVSAMRKLWPREGSPRRLDGYPTYAFGYGHVFVIAFDSNIPEDGTQYAWVQHQLETLDRTRYTQIFAVFHHAPISSGPHGGESLERQAAGVRRMYLPLFRRYHVRMTIAGHEHFLEHWVEHYQDAGQTYRMDQLVTGGGGAPTYVFRSMPDAGLFEAMAAPQRVEVEPVVVPGPVPADNPHHFVIVEVDGDRAWIRVVAEGGASYEPYGVERYELVDQPINR